MNAKFSFGFFIVLTFLFPVFYFLFLFFFVNAQVNINANIPSICGNGILDSGEQCDGADLGGQTCQSRGYSGGTLACGIGCVFNVSNCVSGNSGGVGGGGGASVSYLTFVIFSGKAYPKSFITVLKDAQIAATGIADSDANFNISLNNLSGGNYIFSLYGEDNKGRRSGLLAFPAGVSFGATTNINNIFIAPTIDIDKSEARRGSDIKVFGQSVPNAEIIISIISSEETIKKTKVDKNGEYSYNLDTSFFPYGPYKIKTKASTGQQASDFSGLIDFVIGIKDVKKEKLECLPADLNCDGRVDLVDFSIAAYWYKQSSPLATIDLNGDGMVDIIDFSIIAYYWTG